MTSNNELLISAKIVDEQALRNARRLANWRQNWYRLFGQWPVDPRYQSGSNVTPFATTAKRIKEKS